MKRIIAVVFGVVLLSTGIWFLYRHLLFADFFDLQFTVLSGALIAAGLLLLWSARRLISDG